MPHLRRVVALLTVGVLLVGAQSPTASQANDGELKKATFAGGCFWCMEPPFDELDGVVSTTSGYTGGHKWRSTYAEVSGWWHRACRGCGSPVRPLEDKLRGASWGLLA